MSTPCNVQAAPGPASSVFDTSVLRSLLDRLMGAWKARRRALGQDVDAYFARQRNEHERFLSKATDIYELERLERTWERRPIDVWRVD